MHGYDIDIPNLTSDCINLGPRSFANIVDIKNKSNILHSLSCRCKWANRLHLYLFSLSTRNQLLIASVQEGSCITE